MFENFAAATRAVVRSALAEARQSGTARIGCDHLLLGIAQSGSGPAVEALTAEGLSLDRLRELAAASAEPVPLDSEALAVVGIDLDAVTRAAEAAFGPGALDRAGRALAPAAGGRVRLTPAARSAIELAARTAHRARERQITPGHILLGVLDQGDNAAVRLLQRASVRPAELRTETVRRMAEAA